MALSWRNQAYFENFALSLSRAIANAGCRLEVRLLVVENGFNGWLHDELQHGSWPFAVEIFRTQSNVGYSAGMNYALSQSQDADLYIFANLDLKFGANFFAALCRLVSIARTTAPRVFAVNSGPHLSPLVRGWDNSLRRPSILRRCSDFARGKVAIEGATGACIVVEREVVDLRNQACGEFFESSYFAYGEDLDFFWWASSTGVAYVSESQLAVEHVGSASTGSIAFRKKPRWLRFIVFRNHLVNCLTHSVSALDLLRTGAAILLFSLQYPLSEPKSITDLPAIYLSGLRRGLSRRFNQGSQSFEEERRLKSLMLAEHIRV